MIGKRNMQKIIKKSSFIWLCIGIVWDVWYYIVRGKLMLDSDISSEIILADILNKEHSVTGLTTSWGYSAEIRALNIQWFLRIGLLFFPNNWHMARTVGMTLALLTMAFGMWLVFYAIERSEWGIWAAALTVFPGGSWYFWQTIYGGFYMIYIMIPLFSFALTMLALRETHLWKRIMFAGLTVLIALCSGLNGIKPIMLFYAPLIIAAFILTLMKLHTSDFEGGLFKDNRVRFLLLALIYSAASLAGYMINSTVLSKKYWFKDWSDIQISYKGIIELTKYYLWSFGYAEYKVLMSPTGIASVCGVIFGMVVFLSGFMLFLKIKYMEEKDQFLVVLSLTCIAFCCFVFAYADRGDIQYFQPMVPYGYILVVMWIFSEPFRQNTSSFIAINLAMLLLVITSGGTVHNEMNGPFHKFRAHPTLEPVVDYLVEQGYTKGVGLFWTANLVTELSNGKIEMWTLNDPLQEYKKSLQLSSHWENDPDGRYFYIFDYGKGEGYLQEWYDKETEVGMTYIENHPYPTKLREIYSDDDFVVYGN